MQQSTTEGQIWVQSNHFIFAGSVSGDTFDVSVIPHDLLRPLQSTVPSGPWLFPAADVWGDEVEHRFAKPQILKLQGCSSCKFSKIAMKKLKKQVVRSLGRCKQSPFAISFRPKV